MTNKLKRNKKYTVIKKTTKNMYNQTPVRLCKIDNLKKK